jgi:hypothetical protein
MFASPAMVIRFASLVAIAVFVARKFAFKLAITIANKFLHFRGPYFLMLSAASERAEAGVRKAANTRFFRSRFRTFGVSRFASCPRRNRETPKVRKTERWTCCDFGHDEPWTVRELIDRTMDFRPPTQLARFIDTLSDEG